MVSIAPSMLGADFGKMRDAAELVAPHSSYLHMDVMDGHFVPNHTWGAPIISSLHKNVPDAFIDGHMMGSKPSQWVGDVAKAGGSRYTFHLESLEEDELDAAASAGAFAVWDGRVS